MVSLDGEVPPPEPARRGVIAKRDSEYKRTGTANVFCAVEPRAGRHCTVPTPRRTGAAFAKVIAVLAQRYPLAQTIHLVVDNLNIHCRKSFVKWRFSRQDARNVFHYQEDLSCGRRTSGIHSNGARPGKAARTLLTWQIV